MVVLFMNTKTIFAIIFGYEIGLCAMYSRQPPVNRYFAKSWEPEIRGRCADQVAMDCSLMSHTNATKQANATATWPYVGITGSRDDESYALFLVMLLREHTQC